MPYINENYKTVFLIDETFLDPLTGNFTTYSSEVEIDEA